MHRRLILLSCILSLAGTLVGSSTRLSTAEEGTVASSLFDYSITTPDGPGNLGFSPSMALDSSGNPVVAYAELGNTLALKVLHCNDPDCAGGDEAIASPYTGLPPTGISLALDGNGNPVVSFFDLDGSSNERVNLLHCGNAACTSGNTLTALETLGPPTGMTALALDASGNPVIAYDGVGHGVRLVHCNGPNCAGGNETPVTAASGNARAPSLALDASGNPIVSYFLEFPDYDLRVLHCDDPSCTGGGESDVGVDTAGDVGRASSIALDSTGNPVIAYHRSDGGGLKVATCNDSSCSGGNEMITSVDTDGTVGLDLSLVLDPSDHPVVSYYDYGNTALRLLHCGNPTCTTANSIVVIDNDADSGLGLSLALDALGNPVTSYLFFTPPDSDLHVAHCATPTCATDTDGDSCADITERSVGPNSELTGGRRDAKNSYDYFNPTKDGQNRVDDVLEVLNQYFVDDTDGNPGEPPFTAGYSPQTDRTLLGPNPWNLGPPNGQHRVDDILHAVHSYFHDCL